MLCYAGKCGNVIELVNCGISPEKGGCRVIVDTIPGMYYEKVYSKIKHICKVWFCLLLFSFDDFSIAVRNEETVIRK